MLWVCDTICKFEEFRRVFTSLHANQKLIDISKIPSEDLIEQADSILSHHADVCVFLGYLEPGWMLESHNQTRMRELFRKFTVGFVCQFQDSIPFSWKNEIEVLYS